MPADAMVNPSFVRTMAAYNAEINRRLYEASARIPVFNHQTHHRGQAHALITACGEKTGDTDLFLVVPSVL
jgi:uncharacterized damage-inducible protein DinB